MKNFLHAFTLLAACSVFGQQTVDFLTVSATVQPDFLARSVTGTAKYEFRTEGKTDTIRIDAVKMQFSEIRINGKSVRHKNSGKQLLLFEGFKRGKNTLSLSYSANPQQTMYFVGTPDDFQIWTQGQGKNTSHWLPSFDDANEKVIFNISVKSAPDYQAVSNGELKTKKRNGDFVQWDFSMSQPMSSYLVMLAIGKFKSQTLKSASGKPLEFYYRANDQQKFEPTYRHSVKLFDFLEAEIGVEYPWKIYKQIPVKDFLYAGMENTSATIFAQDFVVDSIAFNDRNYVNVNAHELAHQWFGDMVTAKSGKHHWLQEGFATYYALLAEREVFGDDYFHRKLFETAGSLEQASKSGTPPILSDKASSLTYYQKGAWALHFLRESVGREPFNKAVKNYLEKYKFKNVDTDEFLAEVKAVTNFDVAAFKKNWLESPEFDSAAAISLLRKNSFISEYLETLALSNVSFDAKKDRLAAILKSNAYFPIREEAVLQLREVAFADKEDLLDLALATNEVHVRQAVAETLEKIPAEFYGRNFTLLDDESYITREIAFGRLWLQFPDKHPQILEKMKDEVGFNDKNLRVQWLTFALLTKDFRMGEKPAFYDELIGYASLPNESGLRENAIESLLYINPNDTNVLPLLINPLVHHKWQFSKFAREKIRELIKSDVRRLYFEKKVVELPENEKAQLRRLLDEKG